MFWMFLIAVAAALVFIKLGALSVWVGVLSLTLKAVALFPTPQYPLAFMYTRAGRDKPELDPACTV